MLPLGQYLPGSAIAVALAGEATLEEGDFVVEEGPPEEGDSVVEEGPLEEGDLVVEEGPLEEAGLNNGTTNVGWGM